MSIDFANIDNIIFFSIVIVLFFIVFFAVIFLLIKIAQIVRKIIFIIFNFDERKPKFNQKDPEWLLEKAKQEKEAAGSLPKQRVMGVGMARVIQQKKEENIDTAKTQLEKGQQQVADNLAKLKVDSAGQDSVQSRMPPRLENRESDGKEREIRIPQAKRFSYEEQSQVKESEIVGFDKMAVKSSHGVIRPEISKEPARVATSAKSFDQKSEKEPVSFFGDKPGVLKKTESVIPKKSSSQDASVFGGKEELTRIELKHKLRYDPKVWKAGVQSQFNLSREQREELEKQLFPKIYGRNISKTDFNKRIRMMARERASMLNDAKSAGKAEKLRKEINFLKKISGQAGSWK